MINKWKNKGLPAVILILAVVLALSPFHLFPVCTHLMANGKPMSCYYSAWFLIGAAAAIGLFSLAMFLIEKKLWRNIGFIAILALAVLGYIVPNRMIEIGHMKLQGWQIGLCMSPDMACRTTTMPAVTVLLMLIGFFAIEGLVLDFLFVKNK